MLSPMTLQSRLSNSGLRPAKYPSSVVQTGVKSFGCENRIAHLSPIHSWKRIFPSVVSAVKSGATSPMRIAIRASMADGSGKGLGRGGEIRTRDHLHPMQVRYQAALRPERSNLIRRAALPAARAA